MKFGRSLCALCAASFLLVGCSSVSLDEDAKQGTLLGQAGAQSASVPAGGSSALNPFEDPNNPLSQKAIYFGFDQYDIDAQYIPVIEAHARWLMAHPQTHLIVQGNTDERGGREYNLALGQKRSEAVKQRLMLLGVPSGQIEAVSFGEEKPEALGHDEDAYSKNRRADFYYPQVH